MLEDKQIIIDENVCEYYSDEKEDEEGANPIVGWCNDNYCKCEDIPLDECVIKAVQFCKLKDKQLKAKEKECEELKNTVMQKCPQCGEVYLNPIGCELYEQLDQLKEQIKYQQNFIDSLLLATNNSEWFDKSILDDEASEIIEKIGIDYIEFEKSKEINTELKAENEELKKIIKRLDVPKHEVIDMDIALENEKLKQTLTEIKEIVYLLNDRTMVRKDICDRLDVILQKIVRYYELLRS